MRGEARRIAEVCGGPIQDATQSQPESSESGRGGPPARRARHRNPWAGAVALSCVGSIAAAQPAGGTGRIRDNLFLLEEAYNQEPGVIQHIQSFVLSPRTGGWTYAFTEEWPVPTDRHQLSVTLPALRHPRGDACLGDMFVNYRLQALGVGGIGRLAFAPRVSLALPTGDCSSATGRGVLGLQLNLPASLELGETWVAHFNAGATFSPGARSPSGRAGNAVDAAAGAALVWQPFTWLNPRVEVAWMSSEEIRDAGPAVRTSVFVVNPGVRVAIDFASGLQVVPGLSAPVQFSAGGAELAVLAYLSFEHPAFRVPGAEVAPAE